MFVDNAKIMIKAGDGGDGAVAFRKEKFVPKGGPAGGNGGKGGDIYFHANRNLHTLLDFRYNRKYTAEDGKAGGKSLKDGRGGKDIIIEVPMGTLVKDLETGKLLADLDTEDKTILFARGGKGGKGNANFATPTNQAPKWSENGKPGQEHEVTLELKLIADVGLVGFPNAGKSTLISVISAAKPKIADYPFTTLAPNLGIVNYKEYKSFVVADIPGIIEGASDGKGLGLQFLRHIERTETLLVMIDVIEEDYQQTFDTLLKELQNYSEVLSKKKIMVAISKLDILPADEMDEIKKLKLNNYDGEIHLISSVSRNGINHLLDSLWNQVNQSE